MGGVLAASSPNPPPPAASGSASPALTLPTGFGVPLVSPMIPPKGSVSGPHQEAEKLLPNPGAFDECHRKCKEVFPMQMEGVRLVVNKGISNNFQVNHSVLLSTTGDSSYRFGATFVGSKQTGPAELFPVMVGDMDSSGSLNAQIIHQVSSRMRSKLAFQTQQHKFINWQGDAEFRGEDFTATVTLGNPDVLAGSGIVVAHFLQSVAPALALGGELVYHRRPGEEGSVLSLVGRYTGRNYIATLTLGSAGAHASYYHKANDQLQVGVELEASARMKDSSVSIGYQLDVPKANLLFRDTLMLFTSLLLLLLPVWTSRLRGQYLDGRSDAGEEAAAAAALPAALLLPEPPEEQVPVRLRHHGRVEVPVPTRSSDSVGSSDVLLVRGEQKLKLCDGDQDFVCFYLDLCISEQ